MPSSLIAVTYEAREPERAARFWAALLALRPADDTQLGLRFVPGRDGALGHNRIHLHLTSSDLDDQQRTVARALELGARPLDVGQRPEEGHVVLADPAGYEFDVIEPGNAYLAGTGFLGELACDGTRAVGLFWAEALGWPLVWDSDEETAIQSPRGGTKVAWGGPPVAPNEQPNRQRFVLTAVGADQRTEVERLIALGATRLGDGADGTVDLADPDGNQFSLAAATPCT
ncbi:VOC family protein [Actinoplanes sp. TRM 88003]|uniref:VOC family protein n=1 Tax=Paractinoplanes aksuensis TaxID=2939490 RepID=A0ABT1DYQ2_9ACTN|nr:VOC family protein [Actinoplanes aksuensis]MCO8276014.1 VOC family protein [Actinoplanes aksuensis]